MGLDEIREIGVQFGLGIFIVYEAWVGIFWISALCKNGMKLII
jgi:hypothetical protein